MFFYDKQLYENVEDLTLETGTLLHGWLKRAVDSRVSTTSFYLVSLNSRNFLSKPTIMDKSLGTLLRFWGVFQFTQVEPLPSSHKKCWTRVSRIFSTLYRVRGGRTSRKFRKGCTVLKGNRDMTEKYEYCSTVPRTFVQDWFGVWLS